MHPDLAIFEQSLEGSTLTKLTDPLLDRHGVELWLKRDDLLHPVISGNKWRKLKYNLDAALTSGADTLVSMGGAYSNHLHALAFVGQRLGLNTLGIVRGERPPVLSPTLEDMQRWGMELRFVSRSTYREARSHVHPHAFLNLSPNSYWLPEGGANALALTGVAELVAELTLPFDTLCVACGSGTTLAGLINAVPKNVTVLGFAALKNAHYLATEVRALLPHNECAKWAIMHDYHFGGFAKINPKLTAFIENFIEKTCIPIEPVYTGKTLYGIYDLIGKSHFQPGQRIVAVHTGGLQGNRGYL